MTKLLSLADRFTLGAGILTKLSQKPLTLADLDTSDDTEPLDSLISQYAGQYCQEFEFYDRHFGANGEQLVYTVWLDTYTGETEYEDGEVTYVTFTSKQRIAVAVRLQMSLEAIARAVAEAIKDIEHSAHGRPYDYQGFDRMSDYR